MFEAGTRIGRWVVEASLGAGGMGSVYRCHNADAPRIKAAVKVLSPHSIPDAHQRFVREAEILCRLDHPHIVRVRDISISTSPAYLVMELVEGRSLEGHLSEGAMELSMALTVVEQLAAALGHAHEQGICHRDVKPANVLVDKNHNTRLVDFGIAVEEGSARLTRTGFMAPATVIYAPPEWVAGESPNPVRWDVYGLGVVAFECLTGLQAFPVDNSTSARQQLLKLALSKQDHQPLDPGPAFEDALRSLVMGMTHPVAEERVPNMLVVLQALEALGHTQMMTGSAWPGLPAAVTLAPPPTVSPFTAPRPTGLEAPAGVRAASGAPQPLSTGAPSTGAPAPPPQVVDTLSPRSPAAASGPPRATTTGSPADTLGHFLAESPPGAAPGQVAPDTEDVSATFGPRRRSRRPLWISLAVLGAVVAGLAGVFLLPSEPSREVAPAPRPIATPPALEVQDPVEAPVAAAQAPAVAPIAPAEPAAQPAAAPAPAASEEAGRPEPASQPAEEPPEEPVAEVPEPAPEEPAPEEPAPRPVHTAQPAPATARVLPAPLSGSASRIASTGNISSLRVRNTTTLKSQGVGEAQPGRYSLESVTFQSGLTIRPEGVSFQLEEGATVRVRCDEIFGRCEAR